MPRVTLFEGAYDESAKRICGLCILRIAKRIEDNEAIDEWADEIVVEEL